MTASDHVRWLSHPTLHSPAVIAAFSGWNDAADASSTAVRTLIEAWNAEPLAEIDPEEFTDFATIRPSVRLQDGVHRTIVWPKVSLWHASTPGADVILVLGPEPSLKWRLFTEQIVSVASRFEASMVLSLGALLADVPHSREVRVMGTANDQPTIDRFDLQRSRYEGPTGIVGVLHDACSQFHQHHCGQRCLRMLHKFLRLKQQVPLWLAPEKSLALLHHCLLCTITWSHTTTK